MGPREYVGPEFFFLLKGSPYIKERRGLFYIRKEGKVPRKESSRIHRIKPRLTTRKANVPIRPTRSFAKKGRCMHMAYLAILFSSTELPRQSLKLF